MTIAYTYRITCIPTGQSYYGVRYANNCNPSDLWNTYFTSSTIVHKLIKVHGPDQFQTEIRKIFEKGEDARAWECGVLTRLKANTNPVWLNMHNGAQRACCLDISAKNGTANKGRKRNPEFKLERKRHQSMIKWMYHPETNEEKQASPKWLKYYQSLGFVFGRAQNRYSDQWRKRRSRDYMGTGNPNFGRARSDLAQRNKQKRRWMTNGVHTTKVTDDRVSELLDSGYWIGRS